MPCQRDRYAAGQTLRVYRHRRCTNSVRIQPPQAHQCKNRAHLRRALALHRTSIGVLPAKLSRYTPPSQRCCSNTGPILLAATASALRDDGESRSEQAEAERLAQGSRKARTDIRQARPAPVHARRSAAPAYLEAFSRLQDDVDPVPVADVQKTIEEELGVRLSKAFSSFDAQPLASARSDRCIAPRFATAGRSRSKCSGPASSSR